jgi:predicted house-cleaning noncanonical NTP pyrophosphatase (MazG superfamily)
MSKLVRDKLAELYPENVYSNVISNIDHIKRLHAKVLEETFEVDEAIESKNREHIVEEFADLLQAVEDYIHIAGVDILKVRTKKLQKEWERGRFIGGLILEECGLWERK